MTMSSNVSANAISPGTESHPGSGALTALAAAMKRWRPSAQAPRRRAWVAGRGLLVGLGMVLSWALPAGVAAAAVYFG